jgi:hypothetical protein
LSKIFEAKESCVRSYTERLFVGLPKCKKHQSEYNRSGICRYPGGNPDCWL